MWNQEYSSFAGNVPNLHLSLFGDYKSLKTNLYLQVGFFFEMNCGSMEIK